MTQLPQSTDSIANKGWVLYDGDCPICVRLAGRFAGVLRHHGFGLAPLRSPWVRERLGNCANDAPEEMLVLSPSGLVHGGADALVWLARRIWWAWPLYAAARLPGMMIPLRHLYRWVARKRMCFGNRCTRSTDLGGEA